MIFDKFQDDILAFISTKSDGNIAYHVKDIKANVDKNRILLAQKYNFDLKNLKYMNQIHSDIVESADNSYLLKECDALMTNQPNRPLMVMVADCIPILMYDEVKKVIAAVHAGRNGTFLQIATKTIQKMINIYKSNPENIYIYLGPSIQKCCYKVSDEMAQIVKTNFGEEFVNQRAINLQAINKKQLLDIGIKEENIDISSICTKCGKKDYFSYRNNKNCGRFAGIIMLKI